MIDPVLSVSVRCLLAVLFATAAWHKAAHRRSFATTLGTYRLLPTSLVTPIGVLLPAIELGIAGSLLLPTHRAGAVVAAGLLGVYSIAISINLKRGRRQMDCGCFGPASRVPLSPTLLVRNGLLLFAAAIAALPMTPRRLVWLDGVTIVLAVLAVTMVWAAFWQIQRTRTSEGYS